MRDHLLTSWSQSGKYKGSERDQAHLFHKLRSHPGSSWFGERISGGEED